MVIGLSLATTVNTTNEVAEQGRADTRDRQSRAAYEQSRREEVERSITAGKQRSGSSKEQPKQQEQCSMSNKEGETEADIEAKAATIRWY